MTSSHAHAAGSPRPSMAAAELVRLCQQGDAEAWAALVDRYGRLVYAVPHRRGLPVEACDDVFQAVFLQLIQHLPSLRDPDALPKWLMTTARRETLRVSGTQPPAATRSDAASESEPPEAELERLEQIAAVQDALRRLEPRCRELLTALFQKPGRPDYTELGQQLGMPVGSIGPTRARCLERLLRLLGPQWSEETGLP